MLTCCKIVLISTLARVQQPPLLPFISGFSTLCELCTDPLTQRLGFDLHLEVINVSLIKSL